MHQGYGKKMVTRNRMTNRQQKIVANEKKNGRDIKCYAI